MKIELNFKSPSDIAGFIERALLNTEPFPSELNVLDKWNETITSMRHGWSDGAAVVSQILQELTFQDKQPIIKREYHQAVTGLFFDIGLVCAKEPECWIEPETDAILPVEERLIKIGLNAVSRGYPQTSITERGAATIALAHILEQIGYKVSVMQYYAVSGREHTYQSKATLNTIDEPLNIELLSFWLTCPDSFHRCWTEIFRPVHNIDVASNECSFPLIEYGKEECDIFVPGINNVGKQWTREDSLSWIYKMLEELEIIT
jgi:hypothetical protein